jgi:hypothetical protein
MIRLTFVSTCAPELSLGDLRAISVNAAKTNAENDLTGVLACSREYFLQTLEGSRGAVTERFGAIHRDPRHRDIEIVSATPTQRRWYNEWSMGFTQLMASHRRKLANGTASFNPYLIDASELPQILATIAENMQRFV